LILSENCASFGKRSRTHKSRARSQRKLLSRLALQKEKVSAVR